MKVARTSVTLRTRWAWMTFYASGNAGTIRPLAARHRCLDAASRQHLGQMPIGEVGWLARRLGASSVCPYTPPAPTRSSPAGLDAARV